FVMSSFLRSNSNENNDLQQIAGGASGEKRWGLEQPAALAEDPFAREQAEHQQEHERVVPQGPRRAGRGGGRAGAAGQVVEQAVGVGEGVELAARLAGRLLQLALVHAEPVELAGRGKDAALDLRLAALDRRRSEPELVLALRRPRHERLVGRAA